MAPRPRPTTSEVDRYIAQCPKEARSQLIKLRATIRGVVPDAKESVSYRMPGFSYPGYPNGGYVVWFCLRQGYIGLYLHLSTIAQFRQELSGFTTTKSSVHLPLKGPVPVSLIQKLVKVSQRVVLDSKG